MSGIVVDASAVAPFMIADEAKDQSPKLLDLLTGDGVRVPHHWRLEMANLGRKAVRRDRLTREELDEAITLLATFRVTTDEESHRHVWGRTLALASDHNLTSYDAAYLELALRRSAKLATLDRALGAAAIQAGAELFEL